MTPLSVVALPPSSPHDVSAVKGLSGQCIASTLEATMSLALVSVTATTFVVVVYVL